MGNFDAVVLQYELKDRLEFQNCAEFLRLAGIYVWERCLCYHNKSQNGEDQFGGAELIDVSEMMKEIGSSARYTWKDFYSALMARLERVPLRRNLSNLQRFLDASFALNRIYEENELFQAATTLQYFRLENSLVEQAGASFEQAARQLEGICFHEEGKNNQYILYAFLYCLQKANLARGLCKKALIEPADALADRCRKLERRFPDFSNVCVLTGRAYEFGAYEGKAVEAFRSALRTVDGYAFSSSIYYWIGKQCEKNGGSPKMMEQAYRDGYAREAKYRLCYKMAFVSELKYQWREALKYYDECLEYLRKKGSYLDPLEQEYYYKTELRASYDCLSHLGENQRAYDLLKDAETFRSNIEEGINKKNEYTRYCYELYGEKDAPGYIRLGLGMMKKIKLYSYLAEACQHLKKTEEEQKYRCMYKEEADNREKSD